MPKIVVINNATEQMLGQNLNAQQASFAAKAALRNVWLARPGDVVVSAASPSAEFRNYVAQVTSYAEELGEPHYISVDTGVGPAVLQDQHLLQAPLIDQLRSFVACAEEWSVLACYQTAGVARLQSALGLARAGGARINRLFAEHRGTDLLNRKSHFRQLAIGCGLPLAEGTLVASGPDLRRAVCDLIHLTGKVIVKQDNGAGGTGNCILSDTPTGPLPGAYASLELPRQEGDRDREITRLWDRWQSTSNGPMVVEAYHFASAMFYLEFCISPDGQVQFVNTGAIRVRLHEDPGITEMFWVGLGLPAEVPQAILADAVLGCRTLLDLAVAMGYRGHVNIDAIITSANQLVFNEINARWGGGTVLDDLSTRLLGPNFSTTHVAASFRDVPSPGFSILTRLLRENDLAYDPLDRQGIVILACDDDYSKTFEALVLARSRTEARDLENRLTKSLQVRS